MWLAVYQAILTDRLTSKEVRDRTGQRSVDNIPRERRVGSLGRVIRMNHRRVPHEVLYYWELRGYNRGPRRQRTNSTDQHLSCEQADTALTTDKNGVEMWPSGPLVCRMSQGQGQGQGGPWPKE